MKSNMDEQPYTLGEDKQKTQVLPDLPSTAARSKAENISTQETQIISPPAGEEDRSQEKTVLLPLEQPSPATPAPLDRLNPTRQLPQALPETEPPILPDPTSFPQGELEAEQGLGHNKRLEKMRRTRPTVWAMLQHIFALLVLATALIAALTFFIRSRIGQLLDESSFNEFSYQFMNFQSQTRSMLDLVPATAGILAVIALIFVLIWKHRFVPAIIGIAVALAANLSTQILKNYVITKPNYGIQEAMINSAPSGHTTFAAAAGAALFLAAPKKLRPIVAVLGSSFALAAGFSTIINGWHRPVDVVSSLILTSMWTVLGLALLRFMRSEEMDNSNTRYSGFILVPLMSIAGFFLGFCSLALYLVTYYDPIPGGSIMAATCMILAVASFTCSLQIALLRSQNKVRSAYTKVWTY